MKKIVAINGSNAKISTNRMLLKFIKKLKTDNINFEILEISDIPTKYLNKKKSKLDFFVETIKKSDALIISCPKYLHAPTAALINFFDILSDYKDILKNKAILTCSASHGHQGSFKALAILKQILEHENFKAIIYYQNIIINDSLNIFDENGDIINDEIKNKISSMLDEFLDFLKFFDSESR